MKLKTVKIRSETKLGYVTINEEDFDDKIHKPYKEPKAKAEPEAKAEPKTENSEVSE